MMVCTCDPSTQRLGQEGWEFQATLGYVAIFLKTNKSKDNDDKIAMALKNQTTGVQINNR
jgi:hypothetical protein